MRSVRAALVLAACVMVLGAPPASADDGRLLRLKIASFDPVVAQPALPEHLTLDAEPGSGVFVVQFRVPVAPAVLAALRQVGAVPLKYLPDHGYLVRLPAGAPAAVRALPQVRWLGAVQPGWKLSPDLGVRPYADPSRRAGGLLFATADLFPGEDPGAAAAAAAAAGAEVLQVVEFASTARLKLHAPLEVLHRVARIGAVAWIEEAAEITPRNETTRWVIQTDVQGSTTVWDHGIHGEGQVIGHIDGRIDMNSCWFRDATNNTPGPAHRKVIAYRSAAGLGADSHGTHTAGTSAGDQFPLNGTIASNGNAYAAKISHSNLNDIDGSGTSPSNLYNYLAAAHDDGARVHTNSWGDDGTVQYTTWCVDIDQFSYDFEDSLVLFAVTNTSTMKTPENAKNVLAVGASQNGLSNDTFCSGGRGPTNDGRRKPELFAPGCSIVSARSNSACSTTSMTGTSMACPAATAAGALVRQYYEEGWYPSGARSAADAMVPSGALVKATLLASAVDMTNIAGYPSNEEGWGRVLLENALFFAGETRALSVLADVRNADGMTTSGEATYTVTVTGSGEPLRVSLVWTEPPAALLANPATINNLDLEVVAPSGTLYLGNVIDTASGTSIPGGSADPRNNVEMVILGAPEVGEWTVRVRGTAVNEGTQGYALVAVGGVEPFTPGSLRYAGHVVDDAAPHGNADGIIDPGETVRMPVTLRNAGADPVASITGVLRTSRQADVRITDESASFPSIAPDATATSLEPHFSFGVAPDLACGSTVRFDLVTTSSEGEGSTSFQVGIGRTSVAYPAAGVPLGIPKKSATGVSSTIQVTDAFTIANANVAVDIGHADVGELVVTLRSPAGTSVTLHNRSRAGQADIVTVYDRERAPDGPGTMATFDGQGAQGTWTLSAVDSVGGPTAAGVIRGWTLELDATTPLNCSPLTCLDPVPGVVGAPFDLAKELPGDVRLSWPAVVGAATYRVWSATLADFSDEHLLATTADTTFLDAGALADGASRFYRVHAVNSCQQEGP